MAGSAHWPRQELLDLFATYFGRAGVEDVVAKLQLRERGSFNAPEKILIVLFESRAGSNFLGQLLSGTGWFNEIGESFAPHTLAKIRERYALTNLHEAAQWIIDHRGTPHAFGLKAGFYVLAAAADLGFLSDVIDRAQFVLLRRRDRVAQAVSKFKGRLSGQMHSLQTARRTLNDDDYDGNAIAAHLHTIVRIEADLADLVDRLGKSAPIVHYEDICADPVAHVTMICARMGLDVPADYNPNSKVRLSVLRDDLSARWARRFRAEHPELRGIAGPESPAS